MNDEKRGRSELARRAELEWINNLHSVYCCARCRASGSSAVHSVQLLQSADHQIISRYLLPEIERSPSPSVTVATMEVEKLSLSSLQLKLRRIYPIVERGPALVSITQDERRDQWWCGPGGDLSWL